MQVLDQTWTAWYHTWLLIESTPKVVVLSFVFHWVKGYLLAITHDAFPIASCMDTVAQAQPGINCLETITCVTWVSGLDIVSCA